MNIPYSEKINNIYNTLLSYQNNEQSLLLTHRENYNVPKGQEQTVHCKIAKNWILTATSLREFALFLRLKKFETTIKDNLETMGYTVEILHHPMGRYSNCYQEQGCRD